MYLIQLQYIMVTAVSSRVMYVIPVMYSSGADKECESLAGDNDLLNL